MKQETSEYSVDLSDEDLTRYREKLKLATVEQLQIHKLSRKIWINDISSLPETTWRDVTEYLLDTPSAYTKESIKAYKSLEAYDYFVCGHVQNCYHHENGRFEICDQNPCKTHVKGSFSKLQTAGKQENVLRNRYFTGK